MWGHSNAVQYEMLLFWFNLGESLSSDSLDGVHITRHKNIGDDKVFLSKVKLHLKN